MLAVIPKPPVLFPPGKAALDYPSLRQYRKTVQFVSFDNLYSAPINSCADEANAFPV